MNSHLGKIGMKRGKEARELGCRAAKEGADRVSSNLPWSHTGLGVREFGSASQLCHFLMT